MTEHIVGILLDDADIPVMVLTDDVFRTGDDHRRHKHDDRPEDQRTDELPLMLGEEEEGETHDAVELHEGAEHDEESCPEVLLALDTVIGEYDDGGDGDVELLHLDAIQHLVGTEPIDEHLLVGGEDVMPDGDIEKQGEGYQPQEHTQPRGRYGKGRNDSAG